MKNLVHSIQNRANKIHFEKIKCKFFATLEKIKLFLLFNSPGLFVIFNIVCNICNISASMLMQNFRKSGKPCQNICKFEQFLRKWYQFNFFLFLLVTGFSKMYIHYNCMIGSQENKLLQKLCKFGQSLQKNLKKIL